MIATLRPIISTLDKSVAILTDNGERSIAYLLQNFIGSLDVRYIQTTPHHPQISGQLERFNDILEQMLARLRAPDH